MRTTAGAWRVAVAALAAACALGVALSGPSALAQPAAVTARDAWVREPSPSGNNTAMFVVLENQGADRRAVVSASADLAGRAELHEMRMERGMMRMSPVARIDVPAGGSTELKAGGRHVMLFDLKKRVAAGTSMVVTLTFDDGTKATVTAVVRKREWVP